MTSVFRAMALTALLLFLTACGGGKGTGFQLGGNGGNTSTGGTGSTTTGGTGGTSTSSSPQHFVIVVLENQDYSSVVGSASMPYWNQLATQNSLATHFYADVHPSMGNYFWMTAGQDPTLGSSNPDGYSGTVSGDNVASVLTAAGKSWRVYAQSIPSSGYTGGDQYPYVKHHNPFAYFDSVLNSSSQTANIESLSQFSADVSAGSLPTYSFVVPDDEHNGHDCPTGGSSCPLSNRLAAVDNFLSSEIGPLLNNSTLMSNTIVVVTFDESATDLTNGGGRIPVILIGGPIKTGYQSVTTYQLQSLLRFSLESMGVTNYPGVASIASPMTEFMK